MSICYWGDQFYGVDRIENSELFDESKERKLIIESISKVWDKEYVDEAIEDYELTFGSVDELDLDNGIDDLTYFLDDTKGVNAYHAYCSNQDIMFFGVNYILPWQVEKLETQEEVDRKIYDALKPILKDDVTFEIFQPYIYHININGADDYITYYKYRR